MVVPAAVDTRYTQRKTTVPAGGEVKVDVTFAPDAWVLVPNRSISAPVFYSPHSSINVRSAGMPIAGSGSSTITGVRDSRTLYLYNSGAIDITFYITATRGLVPPVLSAPTTIVRPDSVDIQSQTIYEDDGQGALRTFDHVHIGRFALLFICVWEIGGGQDVQVASITMATANAVNLMRNSSVNAVWNRKVENTAWWLDYPANAPLTININFNPQSVAGELYAHVMSFQDGLRPGNVDSHSHIGAVSQTLGLSVVGDNPGSRIFAVASKWGTSALNELTGAPPWQALHGVDGRADNQLRMETREGEGVQNFSYQYIWTANDIAYNGIAVEITTT